MGEISRVDFSTIEEFNRGYAGAHTLLLEKKVRENGGRQDDFCIICLKRRDRKNLFPQQGPRDLHLCSRQFCDSCISPYDHAKYDPEKPMPARYEMPIYQKNDRVVQLCPLCQKRGWAFICPWLGIEAPGWSRRPKRQARMMQRLRFETLRELKTEPYQFGRWSNELDDGSLESDRALLMLMKKQWSKMSPLSRPDIYFRSNKPFAKLTDTFGGGLREASGLLLDADAMLDKFSQALLEVAPLFAPGVSTEAADYESEEDSISMTGSKSRPKQSPQNTRWLLGKSRHNTPERRRESHSNSSEDSDSEIMDNSEDCVDAGLSGDRTLNFQRETCSSTSAGSEDEESEAPSEPNSASTELGESGDFVEDFVVEDFVVEDFVAEDFVAEDFVVPSELDPRTPTAGRIENPKDFWKLWRQSNAHAEETLKVMFDKNDQTIEQLRGQVSTLKSRLEHNLNEETEELRGCISQLKSELVQSNSQLKSAEDAKKVLEERNQELVSDSEQLQTKLDQFEADREIAVQLKNDVTHLEKENEILRTKYEKAEEELVQQGDLTVAAEKGRSELRLQLQTYQRVAKLRKIRIGRLEEEKEELKAQYAGYEDDSVRNRELDPTFSQTALENSRLLEKFVSMEEKYEEEITLMRNQNADLSRDCASLAYKLAKSRRLKLRSPESFSNTFLILKVAEPGTIDRLKENPDFIELLIGKLSKRAARNESSYQNLQSPGSLQDSPDFNMRPKTGRSGNLSEGSRSSPTTSGKRTLTPISIEEDRGSLMDDVPKRRCLDELDELRNRRETSDMYD